MQQQVGWLKLSDDIEEHSCSGLGLMQPVDLGCNSRDQFCLETINMRLSWTWKDIHGLGYLRGNLVCEL